MPIPPHVTPRLKLDRANTKARLAADPQLANATNAEIDNALAAINQDAIYDAHRAKWTTQVWDRVSPINGVPAQHFLDREDVDENGDDDIYLLLRDGVVVGFQPHEPEVSGLVRIPKGQGVARGNNHADNIAADTAAGDVLEQVKAKIRTARGL